MKTTGTATILLDAMVTWCEQKSIYMFNIYSGSLVHLRGTFNVLDGYDLYRSMPLSLSISISISLLISLSISNLFALHLRIQLRQLFKILSKIQLFFSIQGIEMANRLNYHALQLCAQLVEINDSIHIMKQHWHIQGSRHN